MLLMIMIKGVTLKLIIRIDIMLFLNEARVREPCEKGFKNHSFKSCDTIRKRVFCVKGALKQHNTVSLHLSALHLVLKIYSLP